MEAGGDLFGALVRRRISQNSVLYGSANIDLSLPALRNENNDIFELAIQSIPIISSNDEVGEKEHYPRTYTMYKDIFDVKILGIQLEAPVVAESKDDKHILPTAKQASTPIVEHGRKLMRPYFTMATKDIFVTSMYRLPTDSSLIWQEEIVLRFLSLAYRGIASEIFQYSTCPPPILLKGYSISSVNALLREAYISFTQRLLINAALDGFERCNDAAVSALAGTTRELLFAYDTTLMHLDTTVASVSSGAKSLVLLWQTTYLHRQFLTAIFQVIAHETVKHTLATAPYGLPDTFLSDTYWSSSVAYSWDLFEQLFGLVDDLRSLSHRPYKLAIFTPPAPSEATIDLSYLRMIVLSYMLRNVSTVLLKELQNAVFGLVLNQNYCGDIDSTALITVDDVLEQYRDRSIAQLKALVMWAVGRIQLLRMQALQSQETQEIISYCRDVEAALKIPLHQDDVSATDRIGAIAQAKCKDLASKVKLLLVLWKKDTGVYMLGNSQTRNLQYEQSFKEAHMRFELPPELLLATSIPPRKPLKVAEMEPEILLESTQFLLSSGSISSRVVERHLVEEAKNEILKKYAAQMHEADVRNASVQWRQERLMTIDRARRNLSLQLRADATAWVSRRNPNFLETAPLVKNLSAEFESTAPLNPLSTPIKKSEAPPVKVEPVPKMTPAVVVESPFYLKTALTRSSTTEKDSKSFSRIFGEESMLPANNNMATPGLGSSISLSNEGEFTARVPPPREVNRVFNDEPLQQSPNRNMAISGLASSIDFAADGLMPANKNMASPGLSSSIVLSNEGMGETKATAPREPNRIFEKEPLLSVNQSMASPGLTSSITLSNEASVAPPTPPPRELNRIFDNEPVSTARSPATPGLTSSINFASHPVLPSPPPREVDRIFGEESISTTATLTPGLVSQINFSNEGPPVRSPPPREINRIFEGDADSASVLSRSSRGPVTPGLVSSFSLAHDGEPTKKVSSRGKQTPGGNATIDLSHPVTSAKKRLTLVQPVYNPSDKVVVPSEAVSHEATPFLVGEMAMAANVLLSADVYDLEGDHALYRSLADLPTALHLFALKSGITNDPSLSKFGEVDDDLQTVLSNSTLTSLVSRSLLNAVVFQCKALDQALLLTSIREGNLLRHFDRIEDLFLVSSRSQHVYSIVSAILEEHLEKFPQSWSLDASHATRNRMLWTTRSIDTAGKKVNADKAEGNDEFSFAFIINSQDMDDVSLTKRKAWSVFSFLELRHLFIEYQAAWPISLVFSEASLLNISICSRRLFLLAQATVVGQLIWADIKAYMALEVKKNGVSSLISGRELYEGYHKVTRIVDGINKYCADRIVDAQINFREKIVRASMNGYGTIVSLFLEYSRGLVRCIFSAPDSTIASCIDAQLEACLCLFQNMKYFLVSNQTTESFKGIAEGIDNVFLKKESLVAALQKTATSQQVNAQALLTFLAMS